MQLTVIGSGCSLGGHFGCIYLDGIGPTVPGLYAWATGAQTAAAGANLTYTFFYANGGTTAGIGTHVDFATPPQTTFVSASLGASCTAPAVGASGTVSCPVGTLGAGASGSFTITVKIGATATGSIVNGNYSIGAVNAPTLLGAKVTTTIPGSTATLADVSVTQSANRTVGSAGQSIQYTFKVANAGPTAIATGGLTITDIMPAQLTGVTWSCTRTAGNSGSTKCGTASGSGNISVRPRLGSGGELTYTVSGTISGSSGSITHTVTAGAQTTTTDPVPSNNSSVLIIPIGTARTLSLTKSGGAATGTLSSSPSGITCGSACTSTTGTFADGASVVVTATPSGGASYRSWSGACTGSARTCTVTMSGNQSVTATFDPAPAAGAAAAVYAYAGTGQLAPTSTAFATALSALVTDANGNVLSGVTVTFAGPASGAGASFTTTATTNAAGIATTTATANATAGSYAVTASVLGVATPASFALTNVGPATRLVYLTGGNVSDPQQAPLGAAFSSSLMAIATDAAGNPVPGASVSYAAPASGATATLTTASATSDVKGMVQVGATANSVVGTYTVSATLSGATPVTFNLQNLSSAPASVILVGGSGQSADPSTAFASPLLVVVADALGNALPNVTVTFAAPSSGASATLDHTQVTTDSLGQASVLATANASAGTYAVTASVSGATAATFTLVNNGTQFIDVQSGSSQHAAVGDGFSAPLVAVLTDLNGNPVAGATVTFTAPASGARASLSSATAVTDASGLASVTATAGTTAGAYTVVASTPLAGGLASFALTNDAGAAAALTAVSGGGQSAAAGAAFAAPLVVRVADASSNPIAGVTVAFAAPGSGATATLASATAVTGSDGLARVSPIAGTVAGSYTVSASVTGIAGTASFGLTNTAGAAAAIAVISGSPQGATIGATFGAAIVAKVTDAGGNPVSGATVSFTAPVSGASATIASTAITDGAGLVSVTPTAGTVAGGYVISASVSGVVGSADFLLTNLAGAPAAIAVSSGSPQSTTIGTAFAPIVAVVTDTGGNPVSGATVSFTAPASGASATVASSATTNGAGQASVTPTAGTVAGGYTVSASVSGVVGTADFSLTNLAGAAAAIAVSSGTPQSATINTAFAPIVARVTDAGGNPVAGVTVSFSAPASGASATVTATAITSATGLASVTPTAGNVPGGYVISATVAGVLGTADFSLTNVAVSVIAAIAVDSGSPQSAVVGSAFAPIVAKVTDGNGTGVAGVTVSFTAPSAGATAAVAATALTDSAGLASVTPTAGTVAGAYIVSATVSGVTVSADFALTNLAGAAAAIAVDSGSPQSAAVTSAFSPVIAKVTDSHGNPIAGATVAFAAPSSGATATVAATATTSSAGLASVTPTAGTVAGAYVVSATVSGVTASADFALTNLAGPVATLTATGGDAQEAVVQVAFATALAVHAADAHGNAVPDATVTFTAPSSGASASVPSDTTTDEDGDAQIIATAGSVAGEYLVQAASGNASPVSFALTNLPGAASQIAVVDGSPQQATVALAFASPLRVVVKDAQGNVVPAVTVAFDAPASSASAALAASADTGADGIAQLTAIANTIAGNYDITARLAGGASTAFHLTNTADVPASITAVASSTPQQMTVSLPYSEPLAAAVRDRFGNPVAGASVAFTAPSSGPSVALSAATTTTGANGVAAVDATANQLGGAFIVRAAVDGVSDPATFALGNVAGSPATLVVVSGDAQSTMVDTDLAPLVIQVLDAFANPVAGAVVSFAAAPSGASAVLAASSAQSDTAGLATMTGRAGTTAGSYTVTASLLTAAAPVTFALTSTPGAAATITAAPSSTPQNAQVDHAFLRPLVVQVVDTFGNPVPGASVTFTAPATPATGVLTLPSATTGSDGRASATLTAGPLAGTYTVTATTPGVATAASFALTNLAGEARTITASAGAGQAAPVATGFAAPIVARVEDAHGNPVPDATVVFTPPLSGATASVVTAQVTTDANGTAQTSLICGTVAGAFAVVATTDGAAAPAEFALTAQPGSPAAVVALASATPQANAVGHPFAHPLALAITDAYGNPVPGAAAAFTTPAAPGAELSAATATSDAGGIASVLAIADATAGSYQVTAAVTGTPGVAFDLTNTVAAPSAVVLTGGVAQRTLATTAFAAPVTARVIDAFGNPIAGAAVAFTTPATGATATIVDAQPISDASGDVSVALVAGPVVGPFTLSATLDGAAAALTTPLEVLAIPTVITASVPASTPVNDDTEVAITVSAAIGTPAGTIEVLDHDGSRLASATLDAGAATVTLTGLPIGDHALTARYTAQGSYGASVSAAVSFEIADDSGSISGAGCSATRGGSGGLGLLAACAALAVTRRRRRRSGLGLAILLATGTAYADDSGRAIGRYHAASPDSAWFALDSATFTGERDLAVAVVSDYAREPLDIYDGDVVRARVVRDALVGQLGASMTVRERLRLSAGVVMATWQNGAGGMYNGVRLQAPTFAFGDLRFAGDVRVLGEPGSALRIAVGVRLTLPSGQRSNYMSDATPAGEPRVIVAGSLGAFEYAGEASAFLRRETVFAGLTFGSELRYGAALGRRLVDGKLLVGPELFGATAIDGSAGVGTPLELQLGAHYAARGGLRVGVGAGLGVVNAVGQPNWRALLSLHWTP